MTRSEERCASCRYRQYIDGYSALCGYALIEHKTRTGTLLKLLDGARTKTARVYLRWLLEPKHCIFYKPADKPKRKRVRRPMTVRM